MTRPLAALAVLVLLVAPIAVGLVSPIAAAQEAPTPTPANTTANTPTATPSPTPHRAPEVERQLAEVRTGEFNYTFLASNGVRGVEELPSVRALGSPPSGFVALRYKDPSIVNAVFGSEPEYLEMESGSVVRENRVQMYGSAFGPAAGTYTVTVVYWQVGHARVETPAGNRTVAYAANQTVERINVSFGGDRLYQYHNVSLQPHYNATWHVTAFLEGQPGAQWHFKHRSNPKSQAVSISTLAGAWGFAIENVLGPGMLFGFVGLMASRLALRRTGRGPGFGVATWAISLFFIGIFLVPTAGFYYQVAVILEHAGWIMGALIGAMTFSFGLTFHPDARTVAFVRRELFDSRSLGARVDTDPTAADGGSLAAVDKFEELTDALYADDLELPVVKAETVYKVPVEGVRPFFARLFASPAEFDPSEIGTREQVRTGRIDDRVYTDPSKPEPAIHKPARMVLMLPWVTMQREYAERDDDPTTAGKALAAALSALIVIGPPVAGFVLFDHLFASGLMASVGIGIGVVFTLVMAFSAEDGDLTFWPADVHYRAAEQTLTSLRRFHKEVKELGDDREGRRRAEAMTRKEAREDREDEYETYLDVIHDRRDLPDGGDG